MMGPSNILYRWRIAFVVLGVLAITGGGVFLGTSYVTPAPLPEVALPVLDTPTPITTPTPTESILISATPTTLPESTATPKPELPPGGIIYALTPDINSVGWVQAGEDGNHFGESFLYTGLRQGVTQHGALQFDLSFLPRGATIFRAEIELTGLADRGLTDDDLYALNILTSDIDEGWSRHDFDRIHDAIVDETLPPPVEGTRLAEGRINTFVLNASQRSIIEERIEIGSIAMRLDSISGEGWFAWDSGYGLESQGKGPVLRLGVLPPVATQEAAGLPGSTPTPTATFIVITSTPTPENVLTAAAVAPALTVEATTTGTPTPFPENWVTPIVVTSTPTPENEATAMFVQAAATAAVIAYGTPTPTPKHQVTATPLPTDKPTPVLIVMQGELPPMTPAPTVEVAARSTPPIPSQLLGKIAFKSDRTGREEIYVINPDGTDLALLTNAWPYNVANLADTYSSDGRFRIFTKDTFQYRRFGGPDDTQIVKEAVPAIFWRDAHYDVEEQVTFFGAGLAYGAVWSPTSEQIALISNDSGDDEIWVINRDGSNMKRLTATNEIFNGAEIGKDTFIPEVNRHPSWSPDGKQIVFWSNRTGHGQIWVMDADGHNLYSLSRTGFNDWDPVWIKYPGIPENGYEIHAPYIGPYDPLGPVRSCDDFDPDAEPHESVQSFYWAAGGPARDPHGLDMNDDGIACNG